MKIHVALCCRNEITADAFRDLNLAMLDGADYWKHRFGKESVFKVQTVTRMHVVDGRSTLVENAIKDEADYLWFLDDDMIPPTNTLERLMAQMDANPEYDYIGALCYKKTPPYGPCAFTAPATPDGKNWVQRDPPRLQEVGVTGFACLLGKVPSYKKVWDATEGHPFVYVKTCGEDAYFLGQAREIGQRVAVDTSLIVGHVGTHVFNDQTFDAWCKMHPETLDRMAP